MQGQLRGATVTPSPHPGPDYEAHSRDLGHRNFVNDRYCLLAVFYVSDRTLSRGGWRPW